MSTTDTWSRHCPPTWPLWARRWATSKGSLTRQLLALGQGFEVEPVFQGLVQLSKGPALPPDFHRAGLMRQRLVRLHVGKVPVVLAQTVVKIDGPVNDWHFWRGLGTRSLGSVLFSDPQVKRGELCFARLPVCTPWVQQLLTPQMRVEVARRGKGRFWYARCARFVRKPGRTPLWVMEVFLPPLEQHI